MKNYTYFNPIPKTAEELKAMYRKLALLHHPDRGGIHEAIRFIAVSDEHDSAEHEGDTGGMELAFKFLIHEQYSRDLSMKIKTAKRTKALRGEYIIKNCAFGFKKVENRLEIDEPAAETVRLIFNMAAEGQSLTKIAARLYEDKCPTPSAYKKLGRQVLAKEMPCVWGKAVILDILSDEQYIGTYVAGKTKKLDVGSKKVVDVDESEWIKIPGHHPVIVEKAVFDAAREKIDQKGEPLRKRKIGSWRRYKDITSPLQGKTFCGCCGHTMKLSSTKNAAFHCDFTRVAADAECYRLKMLMAELEETVIKSVRQYARTVLKNGSNPQSFSPSPQVEQIAQIENAKLALYERYVIREINAEEYRTAKAALDTDLARMKTAQAILAKDAEKKASIDGLRQIAGDAVKAKKLSQPIVDALIDKVRVFPGDRVGIAWKIADVNSKIMEVKANV